VAPVQCAAASSRIRHLSDLDLSGLVPPGGTASAPILQTRDLRHRRQEKHRAQQPERSPPQKRRERSIKHGGFSALPSNNLQQTPAVHHR